jgi:putative membrane protein
MFNWFARQNRSSLRVQDDSAVRGVAPMMEELEGRQFLSAAPAVLVASPHPVPVKQLHVNHASGVRRAGRAHTSGAGAVSNSDRQWMNETASSDLLEVLLGAISQERASAQIVKDFGATMMHDHSIALAQLHHTADQLGVDLPNTLTSEHTADFKRLSRLSGNAFDKAYISFMVTDHMSDIQSFQQEARSTQNSALRRTTRVNIPILRGHLALAENANTTLNGSPTA